MGGNYHFVLYERMKKLNSLIFSTHCLIFQFKINADGGRDDDLPRLMYTANNTQMDFVLDKYVPKFNKSRFALEMTIIANHSSKSMEVDETESIDDEYTPGVFRVRVWLISIIIYFIY